MCFNRSDIKDHMFKVTFKAQMRNLFLLTSLNKVKTTYITTKLILINFPNVNQKRLSVNRILY